MTPEEYRKEYLRLLRETPEERHIQGNFVQEVDGRLCYCAIGLGRLLPGTNVFCLNMVLRLPGRVHGDLIDWNDEDKLTFSQIADKMEELYEEHPLPDGVI